VKVYDIFKKDYKITPGIAEDIQELKKATFEYAQKVGLLLLGDYDTRFYRKLDEAMMAAEKGIITNPLRPTHF